jgi:hypothetical protein
MPRVIEVIVSPTGETIVQTTGYVGGECRQASQWLEQSLGIVTTDRPTVEMYASQSVPLENQQ